MYNLPTIHAYLNHYLHSHINSENHNCIQSSPRLFSVWSFFILQKTSQFEQFGDQTVLFFFSFFVHQYIHDTWQLPTQWLQEILLNTVVMNTAAICTVSSSKIWSVNQFLYQEYHVDKRYSCLATRVVT